MKTNIYIIIYILKYINYYFLSSCSPIYPLVLNCQNCQNCQNCKNRKGHGFLQNQGATVHSHKEGVLLFLYKNQRWTIGLCLEPKFSASPYMPPPGVPSELVLLSCRPGENYCTHHFFETFLPIFLQVSK